MAQKAITGAVTQDRIRDRAATEARILNAAQTILTDQGPSGFGVNAVARAAGVDKQLIYKYFGGMDGLLAALGRRIAEWWQERLLDDAPGQPPVSYGDLIERLAQRVLFVMRAEPLARQSALWELTDTSGLVQALSASRAAALGAWMDRLRGDLTPPAGVDAPAVNAMIISAISYLVLTSQTSRSMIGLPTEDPRTWTRIEQAVSTLVQGAYR